MTYFIILNQFFDEMSKALTATGGHYSNFTGDGLMAIYGLFANGTCKEAPAELCAVHAKC